jgi:hypothetical protein
MSESSESSESSDAADLVPLGVVGKVRFSVLLTAEPGKAPIDALVVSVGHYAARKIRENLQMKYPSPAWESIVPDDLSPYRAQVLDLYPASGVSLRRIILTSHRDLQASMEADLHSRIALDLVGRATASAIRVVGETNTPRIGLPLLGNGSVGFSLEEIARTVIPIARSTIAAHGGSVIREVVFLCEDQTTETVIRQVWDGEPAEEEILGGRVDSDLVEWNSDAPLTDQLDVATYVRMIAAVAADRNTPLPLSIGLFGEWGAGKSYFMGLLRQEIQSLSTAETGPFCSRVVQIRFNAWHYADANLWASLAVQVFEQLALAQKAPGDDDEAARHRLLRHLRIYREEESVLKAKLEQANVRLALAKRALAEAESRSRAAQTKFTQAAGRDLGAAIAADDQVRKAVKDTADEVAKVAEVEAPEEWKELRGVAADLRSLSVDLPRLLRLTARRGRAYLGAAVVLVLLGAALFVLPGAIRLLGIPALLAGLTVAGRAIATVGKVVHGALRQAERAADIADAAYERAAQRTEADLLPLRSHTEQAELQRQNVAKQLASAQAEVTAAVVELGELGESQRLYKFIAERAGSDDYRKQLGVISTLRWDFEQLTARLEAATGDSDLPMVDRIVLYIDDLDRCPPERVVQVLEAVHLLLAMKLFVVVVGVDPRWLLRSLERQFRDVLTGGGSSTPQNYLEKIFQIPFVLPGMTRSGFRALLQPSAAALSGTAESFDERKTVEFSGLSEAVPPVVEPESAIARVAAGKPPKALDLLDAEIEFLTLLGPLVRTPRSAKRMANIYRMLRSTRNLTVETSRWLGDVEHPGEFQAVAQLLAVLTGAPQLFGLLVRALADRADEESWRRFIEHEVVTVLGPEEVDLWQRLVSVLTSVSAGDHAVLDRMEHYKAWAPHVARFAFGLSTV